MGNQGSRHTGKVVLPDGTIKCFNEPITAAELMVEHPHQVVVELSTASKPTPLPADKKLDLHKLYLMLPLRRGKPTSLSSKEARQILHRVDAILQGKHVFAPHLTSSASASASALSPSKFFLPLFAFICPASPVENSHRAVGPRKKEAEDLDSSGGDYELSRCGSGRRGWKPSLDTIEERKEDKKESSHLLVLAGKVGRRIETGGLVWK